MAKAKGTKIKNTQSHIRARLDYLHQAAVYLQSQRKDQKSVQSAPPPEDRNDQRPERETTNAHFDERESRVTHALALDKKHADEPFGNLSRTCVLHLRDVAMKTQIRLPVTLKRTLCKRCATLLAPGVTCSHEIRNESRGGKKPWADVLVVRCFACGTEKRFPQTDKRATKLALRRQEEELKKKNENGNGDAKSEHVDTLLQQVPPVAGTFTVTATGGATLHDNNDDNNNEPNEQGNGS